MQWLAFSGFSILAIFIITVLLFFIKEYERIKGGKLSFWNHQFIGIILGTAILLIVWKLTWVIEEQNVEVSTALILIPILIIFTNSRSSYIMILMALGGAFIFIDDYSETIQFLPLIEIVIISTISIFISISDITKKRNIKIIISTTSVIIFSTLFNFLAISTFPTIWNQKVNYYEVFVILGSLYSLMSLAAYILFIGSEKLYNFFYNLEKLVYKDSLSIYKANIFTNYLRNEITNSGANFGKYVLFSDMNYLLYSKRKKVISSLIDETTKKIPTVIFFRPRPNELACYIFVKDLNKTFWLDKLNEVISKVNEINNSDIKCAVSTYGMGETSLEKLFEQAKYMFSKQERTENNVLEFNFGIEKPELLRKAAISKLVNYEGEYKVNLIKFTNNSTILYPIFKDLRNENVNIFKYCDEKNLYDSTNVLSFYGKKILKEYSEQSFTEKVLIPYQIEELLKPDFDIERFIERIEKYTELNKLIICLVSKTKPKNIKNIIELQNQGIKFAIPNNLWSVFYKNNIDDILIWKKNEFNRDEIIKIS